MVDSSKLHESIEEIDRIQRRRAIRQRLQTEFNRVYYNPYRLSNHVEIMDPAVNRYTAMRMAIYEHWKPDWRGFWRFMLITHIPMALLTIDFYMDMQRMDKKCKSGEVAYKNRDITHI